MSPLQKRWERGVVVPKPSNANELILEAWAQGLLVGSLVILSFITLANMRRRVLLHKLILLELILGIWQGFWLFFESPIHAWWLSVAAIFLNASWSLHNVIAWMKIKPFLSRTYSLCFIGTVILAQPYWVLEIYANFAYFHGVNELFIKTRPWEALCRDPWWIITTVYLFYIIKAQYEITIKEIVRISPRFGIMLLAMVLSIIFIILDILTVTNALKLAGTTGINPFWKLAFVFKCLTDAVVLDDFKMALDRLRAFKISRLGSFSGNVSDSHTRNANYLVNSWEEVERQRKTQDTRSPDGDYIHSSQFPFKPKKAHCPPKDSVVSPDHSQMRDSNSGLSPEDIVPSAIEDPSPGANTPNKHQRTFFDNADARVSDESFGDDYGAALREVSHAPARNDPSRHANTSQRAPGVS